MISKEVAYATKDRIDISHLLDTLVFRKRTKLYVTEATLATLILDLSIDGLARLSEAGALELYLSDTLFGNLEIKKGKFIAGRMSRENSDIDSLVNLALKRANPGDNFLRAKRSRLLRHIKPYTLSEDNYQVMYDLLISDEICREAFKGTNYSFPDSLRFKRSKDKLHEVIETNKGDFTNLIMHLGALTESVAYASATEGSLIANEHQIVDPKVIEQLKRTDNDNSQIERFHSQYFEDYLSLKLSLDSGAISNDNAIELIEKSRIFANWAEGEASPELRTEYTKKLSGLINSKNDSVSIALLSALLSGGAFNYCIPDPFLNTVMSASFSTMITAFRNNRDSTFKSAHHFIKNGYSSYLAHNSQVR